MSETKSHAIRPDLLEKLRCPVALRDRKDPKADAGRLRLVKDCWLVCDDSGLKYPIIDGIPIMLIPEGVKWKDTSVDQLPVPPPAL